MGWVHESYSISSLNMPRDGCQNPFVISTYSRSSRTPHFAKLPLCQDPLDQTRLPDSQNGRVPVGGPFLQKLHYDGILRGMCDEDPQS